MYELNKASAELDHWVDKLLDEVKHEDELGEYLEHYGVGPDDNPPGRGSGRYPKGSGERPFQHDPDRSSNSGSNEDRKKELKKTIDDAVSVIDNASKNWVSFSNDGRVRYRTDPEFRKKANAAADLGLKALEKLRGPGYITSKPNEKGEYDFDEREWFWFEDQTIGMTPIANLVNSGYTASQCRDLINDIEKAAKTIREYELTYDYTDSRIGDYAANATIFDITEGYQLEAFADCCEEVIKEMKHSDNDFLEHYGVGPDDNPPGRGSGRYAKGTGERPFQHDPAMQSTFNQRRKKWGIFERIRQRREEAAKEHAEAAKKSEEDRQLTEAKNKAEALKKKRIEALNKARATKKANADKAATEKAAKEKYEAEKKAAIDSGDPEKIAKYIKDLTNQEQVDAINRIGNTAKIKALADEQKRAFKAAEDARIAAEKALEEANRPRTKAEIRERKFNEVISKIQNASNKLDKLRDSGEKIIKFYNMAASVNNALNDKVKLPKIDLGPNQKKDGDKKDKQDGDKKEKQQNNAGNKGGDTYNTTHDSHDTYNTYNNYGWDDYTERFYKQYQDQPNSGEWKAYESQGLLLLEDFSKRKK